MKTKKDKRMIKLEFFIYFSFSNFFLAYIKKIITFTFGAWSFLLVHIRFTPSEGPKDFVN